MPAIDNIAFAIGFALPITIIAGAACLEPLVQNSPQISKFIQNLKARRTCQKHKRFLAFKYPKTNKP